jgi:peptide deformylase
MLPLVKAPHTVLSSVAEPIKKVDASIKQLIADMTDTLIHTTDPEGVGLAAPQVGKSLQLFIIKEDAEAPLRVFINPKITTMAPTVVEKPVKGKRKKKRPVQLEGCLSLKDVWGVVDRAPSLTLSYMDQDGTQRTEAFDGFLATIIQHETDHLHGILFPKHVLTQGHKLYKTAKDDNGEIVFEEMEI